MRIVRPSSRNWEQSTHLRVSPNGPTITIVPSQATTTVLFPHHAIWPGNTPSASPDTSDPSENSESERVKSADVTHSCGDALVG